MLKSKYCWDSVKVFFNQNVFSLYHNAPSNIFLQFIQLFCRFVIFQLYLVNIKIFSNVLANLLHGPNIYIVDMCSYIYYFHNTTFVQYDKPIGHCVYSAVSDHLTTGGITSLVNPLYVCVCHSLC